MPYQIETKRLILRKWRVEDAQAMYQYCKDPDVGPAAGWPPHKSVEESVTIVKKFIDRNPNCFAICLKEKDEPIGCIDIKNESDMTEGEDEKEIGYWLGKPYWGNGYMPEALRAVCDYGFIQLGLKKIWCGYYEGNHKSKRAQEKAGFVYHHMAKDLPVPLLNEIRDGHATVLTKEAWEANKNK